MVPTAKPIHSSNSGFTLIELLVVAGLIIVLTGIGVAAYNNFNDKQKVEQAAKELVSNLRKAQNNAAIGRKTYGTASCSNQLDGWVANLNTKTYYGRCCDNPPACTTITDFPSSSKPSLITGSFTLNPTSTIKFNPLTGETNLADDLTITVSSGTISKQVRITPKGVIELINE